MRAIENLTRLATTGFVPVIRMRKHEWWTPEHAKKFFDSLVATKDVVALKKYAAKQKKFPVDVKVAESLQGAKTTINVAFSDAMFDAIYDSEFVERIKNFRVTLSRTENVGLLVTLAEKGLPIEDITLSLNSTKNHDAVEAVRRKLIEKKLVSADLLEKSVKDKTKKKTKVRLRTRLCF